MRTIKFRAWDSYRNQMWDWKEITGSVLKVIAVTETIEEFMNSSDDRHTFMQFTGLLDKNGKEIYEGDILEVDWNDKRYPKHINAPVIWDEDNACWNIREGGSPKTDTKNFMEVIGNIYENPELLQSEPKASAA